MQLTIFGATGSAYSEGTSDRLLFLNKPFDSIAVKQMALSLTYKWTLYQNAQDHVTRLEDEISQRRQSEERLNHLIRHDPMTGMGNRNLMQIQLADAISKYSVTLEANANPEGHLYDSIAAKDISDALKAAGYEVDPAFIRLEGPLKELGVYMVKIEMHPEVKTEVKVWVVPTAASGT